MLYRLLADLILVIHTGFIAFVILGLVLIWVGYWRNWIWVRNRWFRSAHLAAIAVVVLQTWAGMFCPLTLWESNLRALAQQEAYPEGGFIQYWLSRLIFFTAPDWVFNLTYSLFGGLVLLSLFLVRPRWRKAKPDQHHEKA